MNYQKLTKAQLIARIEELETQTIDYKINQAKEELQALGRDLAWVANRAFELGQTVAVQVEDALERLDTKEDSLSFETELPLTSLLTKADDDSFTFNY